jgi:hypothetical protein
MQLKNLVLLTTAIAGASAELSLGQQANHARSHARIHKRGQFVKAINPSKTTGTTSTDTISIESVTSDVSDAIESLASDIGDAVVQAFCGGSKKGKRASKEDIAYVGNTGTEDDYGCNMMRVSNSLVSAYEYTIELKNVASEPYAVVCFNKIGKDGDINGFFKGYGETVQLVLQAGETATVALEANSQGSCAFGPGTEVPTTAEGCYAGSWVEFDFENAKNEGWSGADCSSLVAEDTGNKVYGCRVCDAGEKTCSTIYDDGTGDNAFTKGTNDLDGLGLNIIPGPATLYVSIGFAKGS